MASYFSTYLFGCGFLAMLFLPSPNSAVTVLGHPDVPHVDVMVTDHCRCLTAEAHGDVVQYLRNALTSWCVRKGYADAIVQPDGKYLIRFRHLIPAPKPVILDFGEIVFSHEAFELPFKEASGDKLRAALSLAQRRFEEKLRR